MSAALDALKKEVMTMDMPTVNAAERETSKAYGIYMDGRPSEALIELLARRLPLKVSLPCGNFRWFSQLHVDMLSDIPCNCGAPYEHYFIKWRPYRKRRGKHRNLDALKGVE